MTAPLSTALIMAGGQGTRMRHSGIDLPKPLVQVASVTLIERNMQQLLKHGYRRIFVSINEAAGEIQQMLEGRLAKVAGSCGATVETVSESTALGNIGAIRLLPPDARSVLIVYADNLTTLDLRAIAGFHVTSGRAMTVAAHYEPFRMPFGELTIDDAGALIGYVEKPVRQALVCSAVAVIGPKAVAQVPPEAPFGISELCRALVASGDGVSSFVHDAAWVDVNDQVSLRRAEALIAAHPTFDLWAPNGATLQDVTLRVGASGLDLVPGRPDPKFLQAVFDHAPAVPGPILRCHVVEGGCGTHDDPMLEARARAALSGASDVPDIAQFERA